jgi:hypothetical protein
VRDEAPAQLALDRFAGFRVAAKHELLLRRRSAVLVSFGHGSELNMHE